MAGVLPFVPRSSIRKFKHAFAIIDKQLIDFFYATIVSICNNQIDITITIKVIRSYIVYSLLSTCTLACSKPLTRVGKTSFSVIEENHILTIATGPNNIQAVIAMSHLLEQHLRCFCPETLT